MEKKFYLLLFAIIITVASTAQQPTLSVVWKQTVPAVQYSTEFGSESVLQITTLPDSSIVYLTGVVGQFSEVFLGLAKKNASGQTIISRTTLGAGFSYSLGDPRSPGIFLKSTPDGNIVLLVNDIIGKFDKNLNLIGKSNFFVNEDIPGVFESVANSLTVNTDNSVLITYSNTSGSFPRTLRQENYTIYGLNSTGTDSLFFKAFGDPYDQPGCCGTIYNPFLVLQSAVKSSFVTEEKLLSTSGQTVKTDEYALRLRSTSTGNIIKSFNIPILPFPQGFRSNMAFLPNRQGGRYCALFILNQNYTLQFLDTSLNIKESVSYGNANIVTSEVNRDIVLTEDKTGGLYFHQYFNTKPLSNRRLTIGRLDSANNVLWSFVIPNFNIGESVLNIAPLDGNDFLLFTYRETKEIDIYRIRANFTPATNNRGHNYNLTPVTAVLEFEEDDKKAVVTNANNFDVKVTGNPSSTSFVLTTTGSNEKFITIIASDASGKIIERKDRIPANGNIQLGNNYKPGVYFVQVLKGNESKVLKLIKQ